MKKIIKAKLEDFELELLDEYQLAAKEAVNNKSERLIRNQYLERLLIPETKGQIQLIPLEGT